MVVTNPGVLPKLKVALYCIDENGNNRAGYPHKPSSSIGNISGMGDTSGRVFSLIPHPARHLRGNQHSQ
ncbi:phosphoribosylformylglycinamidine synthase subunit PurQ [Chloroflexota bacterium]